MGLCKSKNLESQNLESHNLGKLEKNIYGKFDFLDGRSKIFISFLFNIPYFIKINDKKVTLDCIYDLKNYLISEYNIDLSSNKYYIEKAKYYTYYKIYEKEKDRIILYIKTQDYYYIKRIVNKKEINFNDEYIMTLIYFLRPLFYLYLCDNNFNFINKGDFSQNQIKLNNLINAPSIRLSKISYEMIKKDYDRLITGHSYSKKEIEVIIKMINTDTNILTC
jgi:hypothetical protein